MSARTRLVDALTAGLPDVPDAPDGTPGHRYRIIGAPDVPDQIDVKTFAVRCWQTQVQRGQTLAGLTLPLVLWVCTGKAEPGAADDALDVALDEVLTVLHRQEWVRWSGAERGMFQNDNGASWHGWRFDLLAAGQITTED